MQNTSFSSSKSAQGIRVEINQQGRRHSVYLKSDQALSLNDSVFPLALFTSMVTGEPVRLAGPCCETLFQNSKDIVAQFREWFSEYEAPRFLDQITCVRDQPLTTRVGLFFTGGVDSFYSLLENEAEITDLIFVHGFDIKLDNYVLREQVSASLQEVAHHFGKNLIEIKTDIRNYLDNELKAAWAYSHGFALAVVAHSLSHKIPQIIIASSHTYPNIDMWGSHPHVDLHWSSSMLKVIHHGYQAARIDKLRRIAQSRFALSKLRVCWENRSNHYNCGECEKCVRTMLAMRIVGCLGQVDVFAQPLTIKSLNVIDNSAVVDQYFLRENRAALVASMHADPELLEKLDALLAPPSVVQQILQRLGKLKLVKRTWKRISRWN